MYVSIPQAVSTVATAAGMELVAPTVAVSIPQAVSTVATLPLKRKQQWLQNVSIPQAVSTVATRNKRKTRKSSRLVSIPQAVSTVATFIYIWPIDQSSPRFNTASGKYCCNLFMTLWVAMYTSKFQYRKR